MRVEIRKLNEKAKLPGRGSDLAAGYDLYAVSDASVSIAPHETVKIGTGLSAAIPEGYFGGIFARSGLALKRHLRPANCVGVVDADYRGEIIVALHNDSDQIQVIEPGERIAQLVIIPHISVDFEEVSELPATDRGTGGFGSTGTK